jgi:hypothetical protein
MSRGVLHRKSVGVVHRSRAILCRPVPTPTRPIRNFHIDETTHASTWRESWHVQCGLRNLHGGAKIPVRLVAPRQGRIRPPRCMAGIGARPFCDC